ncbi:glycosyltransferase [Brachybacterium kimchii]|uniref:Glycosyl transferase family 28 C-terminal domain-containing protein n=1 Tax=Brachybacterium kimchii TaxID=2942909 RepID=A0ABY4N1S1_9MICO|nr:glycosyltransferase [Brachybacterium kimchii]UQN28089.1 hypothetical protein M4486_10530 [Brachybacterium kimchii]
MSEPMKWRPWRFGILMVLSGVTIAAALSVLVLTPGAGLGSLVAILLFGGWLAPFSLALHYHGALKSLKSLKSATPTDVEKARSAAVAAVNDSRAKASRHEYHQERTLGRIERELRQLSVLAPHGRWTGADGLDVLFVTSNGAGLGHITRLLAISQNLPPNRTFELLTLSKAYKQVAGRGMTVHYFPSSEATGENTARWNRIFRNYFRDLVTTRRPSVVVFDGTWVYNGITDVCRAFGITLVWVQRGMWRPEVDEASPQRHAAAGVVDHVIVPGDIAGNETVDSGPGLEATYVGPIVRTRKEDLAEREGACKALGLDPAGRYVLLSLGGGSISDPDSIAHTALTFIRSASPELIPVQVVSPLVDIIEEIPGLRRIKAYPVMAHARAFEYMVAAAGYNSVQESVSLGVPSVLVPNFSTKTDDQVRRARLLEKQGLCLVADNETALRESIARMADANIRRELRSRIELVDAPRGAEEAAAAIEEIVEQTEWIRGVDTVKGSEIFDA